MSCAFVHSAGGAALPGVAAVEQQRARAAGLQPLDQRGQVREAADLAVAARGALEVEEGVAHAPCAVPGRHAGLLQQVLAHQVRQLALHRAEPEVDAGLAEVDGLELRMAVGHVQEAHLPGAAAQRRQVVQAGLGAWRRRHRRSAPGPCRPPRRRDSTCRNSRLLRLMISNGLCLGAEKARRRRARVGAAYWLTGDFGSSSSAIRSRDLLFVEQAHVAEARHVGAGVVGLAVPDLDPGVLRRSAATAGAARSVDAAVLAVVVQARADGAVGDLGLADLVAVVAVAAVGLGGRRSCRSRSCRGRSAPASRLRASRRGTGRRRATSPLARASAMILLGHGVGRRLVRRTGRLPQVLVQPVDLGDALVAERGLDGRPAPARSSSCRRRRRGAAGHGSSGGGRRPPMSERIFFMCGSVAQRLMAGAIDSAPLALTPM